MSDNKDDSIDVKGLIGEGAFGKVFLLEDKDDGTQYALKVVQVIGRHPKEVMQTLQEVKLLATLQHDHILRYVDASRQGLDLWIITEYCPNGDIGGFIKENRGTPMEESRLLLWIQQIADALQYLHGHNPKVIHRDLKNGNIFLDKDWDTKLGDFGIARVLETPASLAQTQCGTPLYMSPEIFAGIPYTEKTDIYSLGVMMHEMCHMDKDLIQPQMILFKIVHQTLPTMPTGYSEAINDLLASMLQKDPSDRPSATQILDNDIFKTKQKPPTIESSGKSPGFQEIQDGDEKRTILGTLTQMAFSRFDQGGGGTTLIDMSITEENEEDETEEDMGSDEYQSNPIMGLVHRTLTGMGKGTKHIQGSSALQKQGEMLRVYCLQCLNNDETLFKKASRALDSNLDEDDLEELPIHILVHEKYAMCGAEQLYYKNFTFNLRQK